MSDSEDEWLTLGQAAALHGVKPQGINWHVARGNLNDYGPSAAENGRDPTLRFLRSEIIRLPKRPRPKRNEPGRNQPVSPEAPAQRFEERLDRIEGLLSILVGARSDAATVLTARVAEQAGNLKAHMEAARQAREQRDALVEQLMRAWREGDELRTSRDEQSADLKAFADALTQLLVPPVPPAP